MGFLWRVVVPDGPECTTAKKKGGGQRKKNGWFLKRQAGLRDVYFRSGWQSTRRIRDTQWQFFVRVLVARKSRSQQDQRIRFVNELPDPRCIGAQTKLALGVELSEIMNKFFFFIPVSLMDAILTPSRSAPAQPFNFFLLPSAFDMIYATNMLV